MKQVIPQARSIERLDVDNATDRLQAFLHRQRYEFVLSRLQKKDTVLEIGTGMGVLTREIFPLCSNYVGVEFDPTALQETSSRTGGTASLVHADARKLPFADAQFSFVVCLEVLEHLGDWQSAVYHIHRCLRGDGKAIISVPFRRIGGKSSTNEYHVYEPGEFELVDVLRAHFDEVEIFYQSFEETWWMTLARKFRLRRLLGISSLYKDLSSGETPALSRLRFDHKSRGLAIGLVICASRKRNGGP